MIFVGDVHGKFRQYESLLSTFNEPSVVVGDFGVGFIDHRTRLIQPGVKSSPYIEPPTQLMFEKNARFIRGNHDNPNYCKTHPSWIPDGTIEDGIMYIGGAYSIDKQYRTVDYNWWADEELSYEDLYKIIDVYEQNKPEIVVAHEFPDSIARTLFLWYTDACESRTRLAFETMFFAIHKPKIWIAGHWHARRDMDIMDTRFVCLNELDYMRLDRQHLSFEILKG